MIEWFHMLMSGSENLLNKLIKGLDLILGSDPHLNAVNLNPNIKL